jgi:hypothetical protein
MAVGAAEGSLSFSIDSDAMNRVVDATYPGQSIDVPVRTLEVGVPVRA